MCVIVVTRKPEGPKSNQEFIQDLQEVGLYLEKADINVTSEVLAPIIPKIPDVKIGPASFVGQNVSMQEAWDEIQLSKASDVVYGAKISGMYRDYVVNCPIVFLYLAF